jgi:oxygen-independent coproporphyrinogen-3 oxidase
MNWNTMNNNYLINKYSKAGPRYTSYPTVPNWVEHGIDPENWKRKLESISINQLKNEGISIYIHLPYCESLCTFCACHKRITKNHEVESTYISALKQEWQLYLDSFKEIPVLKELHLGGGTPSFFSPENLTSLLTEILSGVEIAKNKVFSFEGHPNNTTEKHLQTLFNLGFRRVSFGVQDYDLKVQNAIHRLQPFEAVKNVTDKARKIGYTSISHDLVFGLPFQTLDSIYYTVKKTLELQPDRIAFYSYAHVPWLKGNGQRGFLDSDLPTPHKKRELYEFGLQLFEEAGYSEVGMDHFALPSDELFEAMQNGSLHRNFMGYTTQTSKILIGLGASAISDLGDIYSQNLKNIESYKNSLENLEFPLEKGLELTDLDVFIKQQILNIMCGFETSWTEEDLDMLNKSKLLEELSEFENDGLLLLKENGIMVTEMGKPFVRNISMAFDQYLTDLKPHQKLFSQTI